MDGEDICLRIRDSAGAVDRQSKPHFIFTSRVFIVFRRRNLLSSLGAEARCDIDWLPYDSSDLSPRHAFIS